PCALRGRRCSARCRSGSPHPGRMKAFTPKPIDQAGNRWRLCECRIVRSHRLEHVDKFSRFFVLQYITFSSVAPADCANDSKALHRSAKSPEAKKIRIDAAAFAQPLAVTGRPATTGRGYWISRQSPNAVRRTPKTVNPKQYRFDHVASNQGSRS